MCGQTNDEGSFLLCDCCDKGGHCSCLKMREEEVPEGDWFCPSCVIIKQNAARFELKREKNIAHNKQRMASLNIGPLAAAVAPGVSSQRGKKRRCASPHNNPGAPRRSVRQAVVNKKTTAAAAWTAMAAVAVVEAVAAKTVEGKEGEEEVEKEGAAVAAAVAATTVSHMRTTLANVFYGDVDDSDDDSDRACSAGKRRRCGNEEFTVNPFDGEDDDAEVAAAAAAGGGVTTPVGGVAAPANGGATAVAWPPLTHRSTPVVTDPSLSERGRTNARRKSTFAAAAAEAEAKADRADKLRDARLHDAIAEAELARLKTQRAVNKLETLMRHVGESTPEPPSLTV